MNNLLDPVILFFILGLLAGGAKSDLRLPEPIYKMLSIYLLVTIGLKGGVHLAEHAGWKLAGPVIAAVLLALLIPTLTYVVVKRWGGFSRDDAAALAAHYGSVSAVTFAVGQTFLDRLGLSYEAYLTLLVAVMEVPAIGLAVALARRGEGKTQWGPLVAEVLLNRSIFLLIGGVAIGALAGHERLKPVEGFFFGGFKGALALFLLEMGVLASQRLGDLRKVGGFLVGFGVLMPLFAGTLGAAAGSLAGLSLGGSTLLAILAASASYIAAPAACHIAIPKANPTVYLTAALGVTFPFNLTVGIPIYHALAKFFHG
ncbi:MAG: sodium-dependent bicarbonate transport family permease [Elusimicrobia bacterium]|nr:sodium-dependent bicarbonate transport family permease [Elusimicrobiota bacterium]